MKKILKFALDIEIDTLEPTAKLYIAIGKKLSNRVANNEFFVDLENLDKTYDLKVKNIKVALDDIDTPNI